MENNNQYFHLMHKQHHSIQFHCNIVRLFNHKLSFLSIFSVSSFRSLFFVPICLPRSFFLFLFLFLPPLSVSSLNLFVFLFCRQHTHFEHLVTKQSIQLHDLYFNSKSYTDISFSLKAALFGYLCHHVFGSMCHH